MKTSADQWKKWEGRVVDGKFPLQRCLGGWERSAVFVTERGGKEAQRAAIKVITVDNSNGPDAGAEAQLKRWAEASKLAHPHLLKIFEYGRGQINNTQLVYVVMEYGEENLAEILPLRPLTPAEAADMLQPAAEALAAVHEAGFTHGRIKPSNILAVGNNLKISVDALGKNGDRPLARTFSLYDAPEVKIAGASAAADVWSLGATLVAVLTQHEPEINTGKVETVTVPDAIPQPLRSIAQQTLQVDPKRRGTAADILRKLKAPAEPVEIPRKTEPAIAALSPAPSKRWVIIAVVAAAILTLIFLVVKFTGHQPAVPAADNPAVTPPVAVPQTPAPAPFSGNKTPAQPRTARGSVAQQVLPDVSRSAQNTIRGKVKVSVQVSVDSSGSVAQANFISPGPSKYFANQALTAARRWKFNPPQVAGKAVASEWNLRFQFGRTSTQVFPAETKP
jgi:TonB family protein